MDALPGSEVSGEHWWTHHGQALAIILAAQPADVERAPTVLRALPQNMLERLSEGRVNSAARAIRHDMLFYSRTPERMAEVLGQFIDRGGDADSAQRFYADLSAVDSDDVRAVLRHLIDSTAVQVDLPPQELNVAP